MPKNARIPQVDSTDKRLMMIGQLIAEVVEERMEGERGWMETSQAEFGVMADALWLREEQRLEAARTDAARIVVDGEPYRRLGQPSSRLYHGRWGAHQVEEPLYRLEGVRNGPTVRPLDRVIGIVDRSLLPELAVALGSLSAVQTSREVEETLTRLGFRPPSRATIQKRTDGLFDDMGTTVRELEQEVRVEENLDFELGAVSCGLDRFAVAMDEDLPDGPERDAKLAARQKRDYERTPPEPYEQNWRMAWAGNVTLYDTDGVARRSLRYGTDAGDESQRLAARMTDDIVHLVGARRDIPVAIIQDGAAELAVLPQAVRERLPEGVPRWQLVDFHHAIAYLDAIVTARDDGDPYDMRGAFRGWLLHDDDGAYRVVRHLRHEAAKPDLEPAVALAIDAAVTYFERRRPLMKYKAARDEGLPIGSGATESTCGLYQLRVKHPGSHWRPPGLRGIMTARGLMLSGRFDAAFEAHYTTLLGEVRVA